MALPSAAARNRVDLAAAAACVDAKVASLRRRDSWAFAAEGTPVVVVAAGVPPTFEGPFAVGTSAAFLGAVNAGILAERGEGVAPGLSVACEDPGDAYGVRAVAPVEAAAVAVESSTTLRERQQTKERSPWWQV